MNNKQLIDILEVRFHKNMHRHENVTWEQITEGLTDAIVEVLYKMETTGGEIDVVVIGEEIYFVDMSKETPSRRRNICYDQKARVARKKFPPESSAKEMAQHIGISIVDEAMYKYLQEIEDLDLKTSSWLQTPTEIRELGGALFGDKRYNHTFIYHNGADSYYGVRGFRGYIKI